MLHFIVDAVISMLMDKSSQNLQQFAPKCKNLRW